MNKVFSKIAIGIVSGTISGLLVALIVGLVAHQAPIQVAEASSTPRNLAMDGTGIYSPDSYYPVPSSSLPAYSPDTYDTIFTPSYDKATR